MLFILPLPLLLLALSTFPPANSLPTPSVNLTCKTSLPNQCSSGYYYQIIGQQFNEIICVERGKVCNTNLSSVSVSLKNCTVDFRGGFCGAGLCFQGADLGVLVGGDLVGDLSASVQCPVPAPQVITCQPCTTPPCPCPSTLTTLTTSILSNTHSTTYSPSYQPNPYYIQTYAPGFQYWNCTVINQTTRTTRVYTHTNIYHVSNVTTVNVTGVVYLVYVFGSATVYETNISTFMNITTNATITSNSQTTTKTTTRTLLTLTNHTTNIINTSLQKTELTQKTTLLELTQSCVTACPSKNTTSQILNCTMDHFGNRWNNDSNGSCCFYFRGGLVGDLCFWDFWVFNRSRKVGNWVNGVTGGLGGTGIWMELVGLVVVMMVGLVSW